MPVTEAVAIGTEIEKLERQITAAQVDAYAEASGDHNPIHLNEEFAQMVGLPGRIVHGLLTMGILAEAVARFAGSFSAIASIECRFSKPMLVGDSITVTGRVVDINTVRGVAILELDATSSKSEKVLTNAIAEVRLSK
jgi:acyl dehydratase